MLRVLLIVFYVGFYSTWAAQSDVLSKTTADSVNYYLLHPVLTNQAYEVSNYTLTRDRAKFVLKNGFIYTAKPFSGNTIMALFLGTGEFELTPPGDIEQKNLTRFLGTSTLSKEFTNLFFVFTDSTDQWIYRNEPATLTEDEFKNAARFCESAVKYLADPFGEYVDQHTELMNDLVNRRKQGIYLSVFSTLSANDLGSSTTILSKWRDEPLIYKIDPTANDGEHVTLGRRIRNQGKGFYQEIVSKFPMIPDNSVPYFLRTERKNDFKISDYNMRMTINENLSSQTSAQLTMRLNNPVNWIRLFLYYRLHVDSVKINGRHVPFHAPVAKDDGFERFESSPIWINTASVAEQTEPIRVEIFYHGKFLEREGDYVYFKATDDWYPAGFTGRHDRFSFDITYTYPSTYMLVSHGTEREIEKNKKTITVQWITRQPTRHVTFNMGVYKDIRFKDERIPDIHMVFRYDRNGKDVKKQVMADVANSYMFFQEKFGSLPIGKLVAAEYSYSHSEAYDGLVNISASVFNSNDDDGVDEWIRAHEVAHQWWGIGVDFDSYHDQWLSEAFAEYSGMLYVQQSLSDNKEFFRFLNITKERIFKNRKGIFVDGQEAGPISLGYRTSSSSTRGDYGLVIYSKGMWVLHMLRNMMLDLNTMNEDRFFAMMKDYFETYYGKKATTDDFKRIVEKHVGTDMAWFFDQWIHGTDLPKYEFAYTTKQTENGKFKVRCRIRQENAGENFQMFIPITIDFGDNRKARMRLLVKGPQSEIDLPLLPLEPKKIIFNDFESVLCEVNYSNW
ncbi:MAG TPA: M1 family aminopeptidase [bacterium]|nr:M1 family aminopeptidase [bacterium]HMY34888.1 M1 family aminopeptidase [bacterium]HND77761.1 M1 family aminopeptidase [bacterium]HNE82439.1 M1 family aminopeptidase [bacterium]HNF85620.1 M1 family aminopeptidase [bacterium]